MKKKMMSVLLTATMLAGALAGCGSKPSETVPSETVPSETTQTEKESAAGQTTPAVQETAPAEAPADAEDPASVTGEFTYWTYTDSANNLVKAFNEVYPNVSIDLQVFGGDEYKTKILTALQSGQGVPDVFDLEENYMYEFLDSDIIADLSYMNIEELTKDFFDFQIASMKDSNGKFKTLSFQSSPVCFWYLRDAAEQWLGTSDPAEISAMLTDWETVIAKGEEIHEKSNGEVSLWPNITEMVKVDAFSFDPLVIDGKLVVSDDWMGLMDNMRIMYESKANAELIRRTKRTLRLNSWRMWRPTISRRSMRRTTTRFLRARLCATRWQRDILPKISAGRTSWRPTARSATRSWASHRTSIPVPYRTCSRSGRQTASRLAKIMRA